MQSDSESNYTTRTVTQWLSTVVVVCTDDPIRLKTQHRHIYPQDNPGSLNLRKKCWKTAHIHRNPCELLLCCGHDVSISPFLDTHPPIAHYPTLPPFFPLLSNLVVVALCSSVFLVGCVCFFFFFPLRLQ